MASEISAMMTANTVVRVQGMASEMKRDVMGIGMEHKSNDAPQLIHGAGTKSYCWIGVKTQDLYHCAPGNAH